MIRGKVIEPIYKKEIREIPYCPICKYCLDNTAENYYGDTIYRCMCGYWTVVWNKKIRKHQTKLTKKWY